MASSFSDLKLALQPVVVMGYEAAREVRNVFNPVVGGGSVAVAFPAGPRTGTMTAVFLDRLSAVQLDGMLAGTTPITFTDTSVQYVSMTFLADQSIRVYPGDEDVMLDDGTTVTPWLVEFGYQEVAV